MYKTICSDFNPKRNNCSSQVRYLGDVVGGSECSGRLIVVTIANMKQDTDKRPGTGWCQVLSQWCLVQMFDQSAISLHMVQFSAWLVSSPLLAHYFASNAFNKSYHKKLLLDSV